ncbi:MAG: TetR/AcrR family transcriptional regulator [Clostridia bacterium]|jgi:TetR/AcrR family transcriptional regulator
MKNFDYRLLLGENNPLLRFPKLQEAAINEFSLNKFEDASLNDILKNADMSKGSLYHHFGDKFGLYLAVMDIIVRKKLSYFYPVLREKTNDSNDFFGSLKDIMKGTMDFMLEDKRLQRLFDRVMEESVDFRNRLYEFFPYDYSRHFSENIIRAVESGQIDSRYPPDLVAKYIEVLFSNLHKMISKGDPDELIHTVNQVIDIIQYGIAKK